MSSMTHKGVILIVDDTPTNLKVLFDCLTNAGFKILVAEDGESAIEKAKYALPDLILLDIIMPNMDGFETCRRLNADEATVEIPVIFMTALTETVDKVKGLSLGAVDYITKPFQQEEVLARIQTHLNLQYLARQLREQNQQLGQEIQKRLQKEAALRESEQRFRNMADNAPVMIWVSDLGGCCTYLNKSWYDFTGQSEETGLGFGWLDAVHPEDRESIKNLFKAACDRGEAFRLDYRLRHKSGEYRWVIDAASPRFKDDERFLGYIGSVIDITERKRTEQLLGEQAALLDVATDAILVIDNENKILFWNKSAEHLYGWLSKKVLSKNADRLLYTEISPQLEAARKTVFEQGAWQGELEQVTRTGKEIIVESHWTLVRDELGQPKSILVVNTDITAKKKLEAQFLRAQRLESIGTLASGIAHDLNNIFTPILAVAQLLPLKLPDLDERTLELLQMLEDSGRRGANLVKQVLSFARGTEGKRVALQVRHLLSEVVQIARQTFPKSIEIRREFSTIDLWMVCANATQLHQVLMNLIVNARDAMLNGGTLVISADNQVIDEIYAQMNLDAQPGRYVVITIADTGTGIPKELKERIFDPFFTTKEPGFGTGLGLSTVLGILKSHNGFIQVYSEVGAGTQFKVYLPAVEETVMPPTEDSELPKGNGELILVVDDEAVIQGIAKTLLQEYNYRTLIASDGIEAIALYAQHKSEIGAVLMDIQMPSMDGLTAIRTLEKINPSIKIIATSGLTSNRQLAEATNVSVKAFLSKPYTVKELLNALHKVISTTNSPLDLTG